jgi:Arc/MetJ-type ribon-helix-helix transcriptional regulator
MSKSYVPGDDADAIIARQVAKGNFPSAVAVVRAGVRMGEEYEADLAPEGDYRSGGCRVSTR